MVVMESYVSCKKKRSKACKHYIEVILNAEYYWDHGV